MAHALGTPLNVVLGHAELLEEEHKSASSPRSITAQVQAMEKLITRSIGYASGGPLAAQQTKVSGQELCALVTALLGKRAENVSFQCAAVPVAIPREIGCVMLHGLAFFGVERSTESRRVEVFCERNGTQTSFRIVCPKSSIGSRTVRDMSEPWLADPVDATPEALELAVAMAACRSLGGAARREPGNEPFSLTLAWPD
jgi:hypothetical protein